MISAPDDPLGTLFKDLQGLRSGLGLREPQRLLECSETFRHVTGMANGALGDARRIEVGMSSLVAAVDALDKLPRETALVEFNLHADHSFPTLTRRQGSLAVARGCDPKTVRRHGDRALETVAYLLTLPSPRSQPNGRSHAALGRSLLPFEHLLWPLQAERVTIISGEISSEDTVSSLNGVFLLESQESLAIVEAVTNLVSANEHAAVNVTSSGSVQADELLDSLIVIGGPRSNSLTHRLLSELPLEAELVVIGHGPGKDKYFRLPGGEQIRAQHVDGELRRDVATLVVGPNPFNASQRLLLVAGLHSHGNWGVVMSVSRRRSNPLVARNLELLSLRQFEPSTLVQIVLEIPVVDGRVLPAPIDEANIYPTRLDSAG
ncbi:MAG: hypothetical protein ACREP4_16860 [Stenotrophomonas sp.]|uniref:hypothetical protein n=1 Tax=Stenotrophomonas sp. TaxID=69392 RepID=UPI003D6D511C